MKNNVWKIVLCGCSKVIKNAFLAIVIAKVA
jgi:hypothetical protein